MFWFWDVLLQRQRRCTDHSQEIIHDLRVVDAIERRCHTDGGVAMFKREGFGMMGQWMVGRGGWLFGRRGTREEGLFIRQARKDTSGITGSRREQVLICILSNGYGERGAGKGVYGMCSSIRACIGQQLRAWGYEHFKRRTAQSGSYAQESFILS
jgi:hypothetical protein